MREEKIIIYPFSDMRITDYVSVRQINEHGFVKIRGQIPFEKKDEYFQLSRKGLWTKVIAITEEGEYTLFCGITQESRIEVKNRTCTMEMLLVTGTFFMDIDKKIRSFQNVDSSFDELIDICNREYENLLSTISIGRENSIDHLIMQYQETDWEFLKRLASMNSSVVIAECSNKGINYCFGFPSKREIICEPCDEYQMQCDMREYRKKKTQGLSVMPEDTVSYIWESREIYEIGDWRTIGGKPHYVWKIETKMRGNILYHTYFMRLRTGLQTTQYYNPKLSGATLFGKVMGVSREKIQLKMFLDENRNQSSLHWVAYSTVYSSQDGTGWYCMPEVGDKVRLYFPTKREQDAYAISAFHEGDASLRRNPECKFWRNKEGKEIRLAPDRILLTNNNGTYIELSDAEGVEIVSNGSITLSASETLSIASSNDSIELSATNKVRLVQGETEMNLGGDLSMKGAQIKL